MSPDPIRGKTLRWTFDDGPMAGKTFEHTFAPDGTVSWRCTNGDEKGDDKYQLARVGDDVYAVSYLASSGFTVTTVLDIESGTIVSFASNEKMLVLQHGTFEAVRRAA